MSSDEFGKYRLMEKIGQGGMAEVFYALILGEAGFTKEVALKRVLPHLCEDADFVKSFIDEARLGGLLNHHHVVQTIDFGQQDGIFYLAMEYVHGLTLRDIFNYHNRHRLQIPPPVILDLLLQLCDGIRYAHQAEDELGNPLNMVHRDLKPTNILVSSFGVIKIADFGIARAETNMRRTAYGGVLKGTAQYMSPEQAMGDLSIDRRSDIFSIGSIAYELVTLRPLFYDPNSSIKTLRNVQEADVQEALANMVSNHPYSRPLAAILERMLAREASDRPDRISELVPQLRRIQNALSRHTDTQGWIEQVLVGLGKPVRSRRGASSLSVPVAPPAPSEPASPTLDKVTSPLAEAAAPKPTRGFPVQLTTPSEDVEPELELERTGYENTDPRIQALKQTPPPSAPRAAAPARPPLPPPAQDDQGWDDIRTAAIDLREQEALVQSFGKAPQASPGPGAAPQAPGNVERRVPSPPPPRPPSAYTMPPSLAEEEDWADLRTTAIQLEEPAPRPARAALPSQRPSPAPHALHGPPPASQRPPAQPQPPPVSPRPASAPLPPPARGMADDWAEIKTIAADLSQFAADAAGSPPAQSPNLAGSGSSRPASPARPFVPTFEGVGAGQRAAHASTSSPIGIARSASTLPPGAQVRSLFGSEDESHGEPLFSTQRIAPSSGANPAGEAPRQGTAQRSSPAVPTGAAGTPGGGGLKSSPQQPLHAPTAPRPAPSSSPAQGPTPGRPDTRSRVQDPPAPLPSAAPAPATAPSQQEFITPVQVPVTSHKPMWLVAGILLGLVGVGIVIILWGLN